jgi:hypothetical protein
METAYQTKYPTDMMRSSVSSPASWAESSIHTCVTYIEDYARAKPLPFALWAFGIGFVLGWKLKFW